MRNARVVLAGAIVLAAICSAAFAAPHNDKLHGAGAGVAFGQGANVGAVEGVAAADPLFAIIDTDGDGVISAKELHKAVAAIKELDTDKDGNITWAEVVAHSGAVGQAAFGANEGATGYGAGGANGEHSQALKRFMQYDKNGDGKLTPDELPPQMSSMLRDADLNHDGAIDPAELKMAVEKMGGRINAGTARGPGGLHGPGMNGGFPGGNPNGAAGAKP
jgi:Ca2+-binding EF-hand superfamily protein